MTAAERDRLAALESMVDELYSPIRERRAAREAAHVAAIETGARCRVQVDRAVTRYRDRLERNEWPDYAAMVPASVRQVVEL